MKWLLAALILAESVRIGTAQTSSPIKDSNGGRLASFPGAEGFGGYTPGGRLGKVLIVTTLADFKPKSEEPIPGSFRAAIEAEGPRTIVFAVSGNIDLKAEVLLQNPYVTIAGQTSPGGVCLRYYYLTVNEKAHDVIIRYLRCRPGDYYKTTVDGLRLTGCRNVIVDHCSVTWSNNKLLPVPRDADFITVQWCIVAEALHHSYHFSLSNHGLATTIDCPHASFHHNLYAHNRGRNPRPGDALVDWRNNVIYDWDQMAGYTGNDNLTRMNYINNYLKAGPSTTQGRSLAFVTGGETRIFAAGNFMFGYPEATRDNLQMLRIVEGARIEARPFAVAPVATDSAEMAYERVLVQAGATKPFRDSVDARIVQSVRDGTGRQIDSQAEVGGWPGLKLLPAPVDSDGDGIPDEWEKAHGLDPHNPADASSVAPNSYTHLENYINSL